MKIQELMREMPNYADSEAIAGVDKTIQFEFSGEDAGSYYLTVRDGAVTTGEGQADDPNVTINSDSELWKRIATGQENGAVAFMMRKFTANGELLVLMAMQNWFKIPA